MTPAAQLSSRAPLCHGPNQSYMYMYTVHLYEDLIWVRPSGIFDRSVVHILPNFYHAQLLLSQQNKDPILQIHFHSKIPPQTLASRNSFSQVCVSRFTSSALLLIIVICLLFSAVYIIYG